MVLTWVLAWAQTRFLKTSKFPTVSKKIRPTVIIKYSVYDNYDIFK